MTKDSTIEYPRYGLPAGYEFSMYKDGYEEHWAKLESSVGEFDDEKEALEYFKEEFLNNKDVLPERCNFRKSGNGEFVATTSVWPGSHSGTALDKIHWVCVHPDFQGMGIAKAIITKALDVHNSLKTKNIIYLTTQTLSYKAINIYLEFGFKPYRGVKPMEWKSDNNNFDEDNQRGWDIIFGKIAEYKAVNKEG